MSGAGAAGEADTIRATPSTAASVPPRRPPRKGPLPSLTAPRQRKARRHSPLPFDKMGAATAAGASGGTGSSRMIGVWGRLPRALGTREDFLSTASSIPLISTTHQLANGWDTFVCI
jgi:hypothetical protein